MQPSVSQLTFTCLMPGDFTYQCANSLLGKLMNWENLLAQLEKSILNSLKLQSLVTKSSKLCKI